MNHAISKYISIAIAVTILTPFIPSLWRYYNSKSLYKIPLSTYLWFSIHIKLRSIFHHLAGIPPHLLKLSEVEKLHSHVIRILGYNPGRFTLQGTNTYLIGEGKYRILIDASDGNAKYLQQLLHICQVQGVEKITDLLLTHEHFDHIGGILDLKEYYPDLRIWKYIPKHLNNGKLRLTSSKCLALGLLPLQNGQLFHVDGSTGEEIVLETIFTPGHCADHTCFLLKSLSLKLSILFSGDCILGSGSCVFENLSELMSSLSLLQNIHPDVIYPGHGPIVLNAKEKIAEYITHRQNREREILAALKPNIWLTAQDIVRNIYPPLSYVLAKAAESSVKKHLRKLEHDQLVKHRHRKKLLFFTTALYSKRT